MKRRAFRRAAGIAAAFAAIAALTAASALAVVDGSPDSGRHPYVGAVVWQYVHPTLGPQQELCSGSLVSPTVFVTAAHCFPGYGIPQAHGQLRGVAFDENLFAAPPHFLQGTVYIDPAWCTECTHGLVGFDTNDIAVVVLDDPVELEQYAALPSVGYDDTMPNNQPIEIVGYGLQQLVPPGFGVRMDGTAKIVPGGGSIGHEFLKVSSSPGQGAAICSGDSGGPNLEPGTNRILAITAFGPNTTCKAVAYSTRMDSVHALGFVGSFLH